ncbi:MAG: MFS transporter [Lachnospiraceae bacterium]|nr:MFS transporter [Lachnospiraceae bacterium]MBR5732489.1 MFS transporter [Lachnospiraceae bacterium]
MENKTTNVQATPLGGKVWFNAIFFGLIGQIAWIVENMYFATFAQDVFANSGRSDMSYWVTTLMVILSAIAATLTTIFAGAWSDRAGKRKPFIAFGYIFWGITIMLFALLPMKVSSGSVFMVAVLIILFDCIMTFAGSTSNDAAFNAWVADNTDDTNRGKLNGILSILPVIAVVIVFVGLGGLYNSANESNALFFIVIGLIPLVSGIIALFALKDAKGLSAAGAKDMIGDTFYGFRRETVRNNKMLYVTLIAACLIGTAQQTFYSYLINFLIITLGLGDSFVIPMAVIILGSAVVTGIFGFMYDKYGRKRFYFPVLLMTVLGILSFYCIQYTEGAARGLLLYGGGIVMMGGLLSLLAALNANFQDNIPEGSQGRVQGVRMCFTVLIPMIIGPIISLILGLDAMGINGSDFVPPFSLYAAAAIVASIAVIPITVIRRKAAR